MIDGLSAADLRYLKASWYVSRGEVSMTVGRLAERLGVSHASASAAIRRLQKSGLLERSNGRDFELTAKGRQQALRLVRRHRLVETFLADTLAVPWDQLHDEAERIEWSISAALEARIAEVLGDPMRDPHGDPIPPMNGNHEEAIDLPLAQVPSGATATIVRVLDDDAELLRYLAGEGLGIGTTVTVEGRDPFGGPLWLSSGQGRHALGRPAVRAISVADVTNADVT